MSEPILDKFIGYISPSWHKNRMFNRLQVDEIRSYRAAQRNRLNNDWPIMEVNNDADLIRSLSPLRARSSDMVKNDPYAERVIDTILENAISSGVKIELEDKKAKKLWEIFSSTEEADYQEKYDLNVMQYMAWRTTLEFGECILMKRRVQPSVTYPFSFKIQLLPPRYLAVDYSVRTDTTIIKAGIEYDKDGRIINYHLFKNDPLSEGATTERIVVPASDISLVIIPKTLGVDRGRPYLTSTMTTLRNLDEYEDAEMHKQRYHAFITAFIQTPPEDEKYTPIKKDHEEKVTMGTIKRLRPGETMFVPNPPSLANYPEHVKQSLMKVSTGTSIPYPILSEDYSSVNYSSFRGNLIKFDNSLTVLKSIAIIPRICRPIVRWFFEDLEALGIKIKNKKATYVPPKLKYLDPSKEIPAQILAIRAGLTSWGREIRANGENPDDLALEIKKWNEVFDQLGLSPICDPRVHEKGGPSDIDKELASKNSAKNKDQEDEDDSLQDN